MNEIRNHFKPVNQAGIRNNKHSDALIYSEKVKRILTKKESKRKAVLVKDDKIKS